MNTRALLAPLLWVHLILFSSTAFSAEPVPTLDLLKKLIEIDTSNPPGNEMKAAQFLRDYLGKFGIEAKILESAPGRGNLVARIPSTDKRESLLLLGHLDVVPADPMEWDSPPFQPTILDGYLYGRGALDMKAMVALEVQTFIAIHQEKKPLEGDLILALTADEEAGGKFGAEFLLEHHSELVKSSYVFNEGSVGQVRGSKHLYPIQVAEKGVAWIRLTAQGQSGHGSMPSSNNAVVFLLEGMERLTKKSSPFRKTPIAEEFLKRLAPYEKFPLSFAMKHFFSFPVRWWVSTFFSEEIAKEKVLNAMLRDTVVPTILKAGFKTNVIPSEAIAELDIRLLPGKTPELFLQEVQEKLQGLPIQAELITKSAPNSSDFQTPYFSALEKAILKEDPEGIVVPFISPGATDSRFFRESGALAYGLIPLLLQPEDLEGLHGKNERIPVAELEKGERILKTLIQELLQGKSQFSDNPKETL